MTALTVQQKQNQALDLVRRKMHAVKDRLFEGAPRHISPGRIITSAMLAFRDNPRLLECTIESQMDSIRRAAFYGWEIGGPMSQAYLVPYKDKCTLIPGYRGLIDMMRRSGQVTQIDSEVVHQCDRFSVRKGDDASINHEISSEPNRKQTPITHVYVIVHLTGGARQRSVWTATEIDYHKEQHSEGWRRAEANGKRDSPWHKHWETMAYKTIIVAMVKRGLVPVSGEIRESLDKDESLAGLGVQMPPLNAVATDTATIEPDATETQAIEDQGQRLHGPSIDELIAQLQDCKSYTAVADFVTKHSDGCTEDVVKQLLIAGEKRKAAIKAGRGEGSNKQKSE